MNITNDIIKIVNIFLNTSDLKHFRTCSKQLSKTTSTTFFSSLLINLKKTNIDELKKLVEKYNFPIKIYCEEELTLPDLNIKLMHLNFLPSDWKYIPKTIEELVFSYFKGNIDEKIHSLKIKTLTIPINKCTYIPETITNLNLTRKNMFTSSYSVFFNNIQTLQLPFLPVNQLSDTITELTFDKHFNEDIKKNILPTNLKKLTFGTYFNSHIYKNALPSSLTSLTFGKEYNYYAIPLPINLEYLEFGDDFNSMIQSYSLPKNLKEIKFGKKFNKPIDLNILPKNLNTLTFGHDFNQCINNIFPQSLKTLIFGNNFNETIEVNSLPNLETLIFGDSFKKPFKCHVLPASLQILIFGSQYDVPFKKNVLPYNLKTLILGELYSMRLNNLPESLNKLVLRYKYNQPIKIPKKLQYLTVCSYYSHELILPKMFRVLYYCNECLEIVKEVKYYK